MNLTTHWILAIAIGIALFHSVEIALIMSIGALIPDLDREYLFVAKDFIARHQLHRSLFHNFLFIGALYFVNPFLSLGALSHSLLDMFTSATDRGCEVLFPFTRIVRRFYYNIEGSNAQTAKKTSWWVEDPWRLLQKTSDRDLQEPKEQAWRRSYGPFKNSRVVDWGIFFGSLIFLLISYAREGGTLYSMSDFHPLALLPLGGIAIFYGLGEVWRRRIIYNEPQLNQVLALAILVIGLVFLVLGVYKYVYAFPGFPNLTLATYGLISVIIGMVIGFFFVRLRKHYGDLSM